MDRSILVKSASHPDSWSDGGVETDSSPARSRRRAPLNLRSTKASSGLDDAGQGVAGRLGGEKAVTPAECGADRHAPQRSAAATTVSPSLIERAN